MKIKEIILFTENIEGQKQFYQEVLNFKLIHDTAAEIAFKTGESTLTFRYKEGVKPAHVAFNIPSDAIEEALHWLQERVTILPDGKYLISDFNSWQARAIYFYDADRNIMEFIARKPLNIQSSKPFLPDSILSISEVGIAVNDIKAIYNSIMALQPIPVFDGNFQRFCALGDTEGLFILVNKIIKKWHPTQEEAFTSEFIIRGDYNFAFSNGEIKEIS